MAESHAIFYEQFLKSKFLNLKNCPTAVDTKNLVSPFVLSLSSETLGKVQDFVKTLYEVSRQPEYLSAIAPLDPEIAQFSSPNDSVLMAYDFHLDKEGNPKLIEINTNASGYLFSSVLYEYFKVPTLKDPLEELKKSFHEEWERLSVSGFPQVAIIDETLLQQKMLPEFYIYQELMQSWGWEADILDFQSLQWKSAGLIDTSGKSYSLVYNRFNDFYLRRPESLSLRKAYLSGEIIFTPQPKEYLLLADKQRLLEWSRPHFFSTLGVSSEQESKIRPYLLQSFLVQDFDSLDTLWSQRKKYFFKPLRMYGGKATYRGSQVSRKAFERITSDPQTLVQEYCPAPLYTDETGQDWKYDLRFYVFRNEIQLAVARVYQGQVTNFSAVGGGFSCINFEVP